MISNLNYGHSLDAPSRLAGQETHWALVARGHEEMARTAMAAACSCPDGVVQNWWLGQAQIQEKAAQKCWARVKK